MIRCVHKYSVVTTMTQSIQHQPKCSCNERRYDAHMLYVIVDLPSNLISRFKMRGKMTASI